MTDREWQIMHLERIYRDAALSPFFKDNPRFSSTPDEPFFRIAYADVMNNRFVIRRTPDSENSFWSEEATVIATYGSIADIVDDGWRLD